ncbi:methylated-DNA--[protein]-cysteine S-methyltransferase [Micrococcales bacterium 31B]|nr:methylated-DNA--[protein]-cysteine S-methyltransferase [Micrococcales bacterium 31B]
MSPDRIIGTEFGTPVGPLAVFARVGEGGALTVVGSGFVDLAGMAARMGARAPAAWTLVESADAAWAGLRVSVERYFEGTATALDGVQVEQGGGDFSQRAWEALRTIPAGQTRTYSELAEAAGNSQAVRAAGTACARNLVAPFVPCHRVLRRGGDVGQYAFGSDVKKRLLSLEAAAGIAAGDGPKY